MATLIAIRDKADIALTEFWQALVPRQDAYFVKHGKYFQLLVTNSVIDGVDTIFEVRHPNDELHQIDVGFTFNSNIPFSISVNEWIRGNDAGYTAIVVVELLDGRKFTRNRTNLNVDSGWYELIEESI